MSQETGNSLAIYTKGGSRFGGVRLTRGEVQKVQGGYRMLNAGDWVLRRLDAVPGDPVEVLTKDPQECGYIREPPLT